jgi:hypothetical protein
VVVKDGRGWNVMFSPQRRAFIAHAPHAIDLTLYTSVGELAALLEVRPLGSLQHRHCLVDPRVPPPLACCMRQRAPVSGAAAGRNVAVSACPSTCADGGRAPHVQSSLPQLGASLKPCIPASSARVACVCRVWTLQLGGGSIPAEHAALCPPLAATRQQEYTETTALLHQHAGRCPPHSSGMGLPWQA